MNSFDWALMFGLVEKVAMILIGVVGWLIRRALNTQERKIDAILQQVHLTNGRVGRLEEWKIGHEKSVDGIHDNLRASISNLWGRLNNFVDDRRER